MAKRTFLETDSLTSLYSLLGSTLCISASKALLLAIGLHRMDIDPSLTATKLRSRRRYSSDDSSQSSDDHPHEYALSPAEHAYKSLYPRFRARSSIPSSIGDWEGVFSDSDSGEEQAPPTKKLKLSESKKSSFHEAESTKPSRSAKKSSSSSGDGNPSKQALNGVTSISKPCDQCSSSTDEADRAPSNAVQASSLNSDAHARSLVELERLYSSQQKSVAALSSQMAEILLQIQTMGQQLVTLINDRHRKDTDSSSSEDEAPRSKGKRHRLKEPDNDPNVRNMGLEKLVRQFELRRSRSGLEQNRLTPLTLQVRRVL